jgi:hypothetical protein
MTESQPIRFTFAKINTDEFAIVTEKYDLEIIATMQLGLAFNFVKEETSIGVQAKCVFHQEGTVLIVIAVTCWFKIILEDWDTIYQEDTKQVVLSRINAMHFASLTISTTRGVLHAKTETFPLNNLMIPPVNLNDLIKEDVSIIGFQQVAQATPGTNG